MSFNWHTEDDDENWVNDDEIPPSSPKMPNYRTIIIAIVAFLAVTVVTLQLYINRFVAEQEDVVKEEVIAAYDLLYGASETRDVDLFTFLLSATDLNWNQHQQSLLSQGRMLNHALPGSHLVSRTEPSVELSANFNEAIVTQMFTYQENPPSKNRYRFEQTVIFRKGVDRWLFTVPNRSFWGESGTLGENGALITLNYQGRDAEFSERLYDYMERTMTRYSLAAGRSCLTEEPTTPTTIQLSDSPAQLESFFTPPFSMKPQRAIILELPTITLFGKPFDKASEEALFATYTAHLISQQSYMHCGGQIRSPYFIDWALVAFRLQNLELPYLYHSSDTALDTAPPPETHEMLWQYNTLWRRMDEAEMRSNSGYYWEEQFHGLELVRFLQYVLGEEIIWQAELHGSIAQFSSFDQWITDLTGQSMNQLETAYAQYLQSGGGLASSAGSAE